MHLLAIACYSSSNDGSCQSCYYIGTDAGKNGNSKKIYYGFDDHADVSLFPKFLLPKNFNLRSINANEGLLIKGVTGNSLKNAGTLFLKVSLRHTWFKIKF